MYGTSYRKDPGATGTAQLATASMTPAKEDKSMSFRKSYTSYNKHGTVTSATGDRSMS
jgi:hypothetical protein